MKRILFDAHAILKWPQKERGYQRVKALMIECRDQIALGYMNQINLGEAYYKTIRVVGSEEAKKFLENFSDSLSPSSSLIANSSGKLQKSRRNIRFPMLIVLPPPRRCNMELRF